MRKAIDLHHSLMKVFLKYFHRNVKVKTLEGGMTQSG
jgi:hypothetical protein